MCTPVREEAAKNGLLSMYQQIKKANKGFLPNIFQHMGNSPAVLEAFLHAQAQAEKMSLSKGLRGSINLFVSTYNQCNYCATAHAAIASACGLQKNTIMDIKKGASQDPFTQAVLHFCGELLKKQGKIDKKEIERLKAAGATDAQIVEIVFLIGLNLFTNYFNNAVQPVVDFPDVLNLPSAKGKG